MSGEPDGERVIAGRYRLLSPLGEGGMGTVWRARDEVLRREVAVKEVRAPAGLSQTDVGRMYARLEREAWAAARISHPNVVTVYDVATDGGRPWIVMELVRGLSLADLLDAEGPLEPRRAALIGAEVLAALRAAHAAGVLHRDVKPANVLLANDGRVVLTDFGIARVEGSEALTMTGEVVGSPEFLAPERALGRTPGAASDLWSLGVLLYAAVEGVSPFRQGTPLSTLRAIVDEEVPPPRRAGALGPVVEGLLRKDPAERLPAEEAERALRLVGTGGAPPGRGPRTGAPPSGAFAPTVVAAHPGPPTAPTPPMPVPAAGDTSAAGAPGAPGGRDRRARAVLLVGLAVLVLALAGLTYSLLDRSDGGGGTEGSGGSPGPGATSAAASGGAGEPSPPASSGTGGGQSGPAAQSVEVTVVGSRTHYSGACPPPHDRAPAFTATFTVGRLPAEVGYRWVTADGSVSDPGWRTLSFPSGGERSRQDGVVVTTHDDTGAFESAVRVEVRSPVRATSDAVAFSVTCGTGTGTGTGTETGTGTPSGGASHSSSPSAPSSSPSA
ncbi:MULTISPECIES: serine/threonine-protein kinase [Streptomyces]|uniref:serine/threonine-protein kinase n=1 Tax=Streptomyces TaxID=1883 RepID=UPI0029ABF47D|nr:MULTISPECIES: serine/threonine-protein kinase [unclassified Streptomyces]MDX3345327.1 serine/threonine-protein kinase [Streptomyces sp. ME02-6979A]MDX3398917.1 serine/threonine-protein kinase [Streptomyces sp. ME01-18h]